MSHGNCQNHKKEIHWVNHKLSDGPFHPSLQKKGRKPSRKHISRQRLTRDLWVKFTCLRFKILKNFCEMTVYLRPLLLTKGPVTSYSLRGVKEVGVGGKGGGGCGGGGEF